MALQDLSPAQTPSAPTRRRLGIATRMENIRTLASQWKALAVSSKSASTQYEWVDAAAQHFTHEGQLHVMFLHDGGRLLAAAPLSRRTIGGAQCLTGLDGGALGEPVDFLAADPESLKELCVQVAGAGWPLWLERVAVQSPLVAAMRRLAKRHRVGLEEAPAAPLTRIEIDRSWGDPESRLPPAWQADYVQARHAAEQRGYSLFHITAPPTQTLSALLQELIELEYRGWRSQVGQSLMQQRELRDFVSRYATGMCHRGKLRIGFYRIGSATAAAVLAVQTEDSLCVLRMAFDGSLGDCSPETLLMAETLRYAVSEKLKVVQFHEISAPWTDPWPKQYQDCVSLKGYPRTLSGMVASAVMRLMPGRTR
jgi:CelD/BcsL family acetyltransferase involved in cellulose biosynthesis